jgi:UDPglucose 6-dehydrogenase
MIGFAGLSHLGIVSSIAAAAKGFEVVAYDSDSALIDALNRGHLSGFEPDLEMFLENNRSRIQFVSDPATLASCKVLFFSVDVPTNENDQSDLVPLQNLIDSISSFVAADGVRIVLSQVPPGFTRAQSGSKESLFYQVESLVFGQAVERALNPERFIVGCADPRDELPVSYADFLAAFDCPILKMRYESAELAKISINVCLVSSISTANMMAELCESIGADWSEISPALKLDRRIGPYAYLTPGLGIGGGNLLRDLATVKNLASAACSDVGILDAWLINSRYRRDWALRIIHQEVISQNAMPVISMWGLAYKPDTASTKNSPALALVEALDSFQIQAYDPQAELDEDLGHGFSRVSNALEACCGSDVLAIMTPWPEFSDVEIGQIAETMKGRVIVDPFGVLDRKRCIGLGFQHYGLGWPQDNEENIR